MGRRFAAAVEHQHGGIVERTGEVRRCRVRDTELDELAALLHLAPLLIHLAPLLIANNSGPVHVAAAVGTPVVVLYALTNPQHGPWMVPHRVLSHDVPCKYCYESVCPAGHHECLRSVAPEDVVDAARALLDSATAQKRQTWAGGVLQA